MKYLKKIYNWLVEYELLGIVIAVVIVKFSYDLVALIFPNIPWDQRLNPGVDAFIYWFQTAAIFFLTITVVWIWFKSNFPTLAGYLQDAPEDDALRIATVDELSKKEQRLLAIGIPAFMLIVFSLLALAVFP